MIAIWPCRIRIVGCILLGVTMSQPGCQTPEPAAGRLNSFSVVESFRTERQITHGPGGRILSNTGVWSPDGEWIVYDTRSDAAGDKFDGDAISMVNVHTGETRELYRSK